MVIWIMGLSASGKTTLGRCVYEKLKKEFPNTVFLDGDEIRKIFKHDNGYEPYTLDGRKKNADRICELCAWLDRQDINVVCCILSIFEVSRGFNRQTFSEYFEVYIDVSMQKLRQRETKGLYEQAEKGAIKNVVGVDMPFSPPSSPDYIFSNIEDNPDFDKIALDIIEKSKRNKR